MHPEPGRARPAIFPRHGRADVIGRARSGQDEGDDAALWVSAGGADVTQENINYRGYNVITRDIGGFHYCLVSDMDESGLGQLADDLGK